MSGSVTPVCPCGTPVFPWVICNQPGHAVLAGRVGDYLAFRHQLLRALPGEIELPAWRPGAEGDLAVQMLEWWAYLADILTFYNERILNEAYLRTALLPESVNHLVQILGYRPRPALGARGVVAALLNPGARVPLMLPAGLALQSKPGPGQQPQVFELDAPTTVGAPDAIASVVSPASQPSSPLDGSHGLWLAGKVSGIKTGERFLLINAAALTARSIVDYAWITVTGTAPLTDPLGKPVTQVTFQGDLTAIGTGPRADQMVLLRSGQSAPPWSFPTSSAVITNTSVDLANIARDVVPGSLVLLDVANVSNLAPTPLVVTSYTEVIWYANCLNKDDATVPPAVPTPAVAIPHASVGFAALPDNSTWNANRAHVTARWGWTPVGQLVPVLSASDFSYIGGATALAPAPGAEAFPTTPTAVLLEDANGLGGLATTGSGSDATGGITLNPITPPPPSGFASPISVLFNQLRISRGNTVPFEVLGSGNPAVAGQDFTLKQAPVTYFADTASISGDNFSSTVQVSVNGVRWAEARSFFDQKPNAQIFVLREDDAGKTHVTFGDGVNGALLPTGTDNVVASYRYGAGAVVPATGALTVVLTPQPGLKGVRNPLQPTGGADADPASRLRDLAPRSVLTFNRAVSVDDYAALAATAAGVRRVSGGVVFDPLALRPIVTLWVAGDPGADDAVRTLLAGVAMPNQGLRVSLAIAVVMTLILTYVRDPRMADDAVRAALVVALVDPDAGLLGINRVGIGQPIYDSQIEAACLAVPGVLAVHKLQFDLPAYLLGKTPPKGQPAGSICAEHRHDPGDGKYFVVPNTPAHLKLSGVVAS